MGTKSCPGQDKRHWTKDDIYDVTCPACGAAVEFFKTDSIRKCGKCGYQFMNPKLNMGCAEWCPAAKECLAVRMYAPEKAPEE